MISEELRNLSAAMQGVIAIEEKLLAFENRLKEVEKYKSLIKYMTDSSLDWRLPYDNHETLLNETSNRICVLENLVQSIIKPQADHSRAGGDMVSFSLTASDRDWLDSYFGKLNKLIIDRHAKK